MPAAWPRRVSFRPVLLAEQVAVLVLADEMRRGAEALDLPLAEQHGLAAPSCR